MSGNNRPSPLAEPVTATAPREDAYDVVVIGSGLGGLSSAALLAKAGRRVLVAEKASGIGGYSHAFQRGPYLLDSADHVLPQGGKGQAVQAMIDHLEIADEVRLLPIADFASMKFPGMRLTLHQGREQILEGYCEAFPEHAEEIKAFLELCWECHRVTHEMPMNLRVEDLQAMVDRFPTFFKYRMATLGEGLEDVVSDPKARSALGMMWPYMALPPSQLSFLTYMSVFVANNEGVTYPEHSFQSLVDALVSAVHKFGGEVIAENGVARVLVDDGAVSGVVLADGQTVRTPVAVSNADATHTFEELVGEEQLPKGFVRRLRRLEVSVSAFVVYTSTTLDMRAADATHDTFLYRHWDHDETWRDVLAGRPGGMSVLVPTITDPSLAPPGEHLVIVSTVAPYDAGAPWAELKERYAEEVIGYVDELYPGFRDSVVFSEAATPHALERFNGSRYGASYGWAQTPGQAATKRPGQVTPIEGLYLVGAWTLPGPGTTRVIASGIQTAALVAAGGHFGDAVETFSHRDIPDVLA